MQNAGAAAAGTGLLKSNEIYKIALKQAEAVSSERNATGKVDVVTVKADPPIINSNGVWSCSDSERWIGANIEKERRISKARSSSRAKGKETRPAEESC